MDPIGKTLHSPKLKWLKPARFAPPLNPRVPYTPKLSTVCPPPETSPCFRSPTLKGLSFNHRCCFIFFWWLLCSIFGAGMYLTKLPFLGGRN